VVQTLRYLSALILLPGVSLANIGPFGDWTYTSDLGVTGEWKTYGYEYADIDTVALRSNELTITLEYPDRVSVRSKYFFESLKPRQDLLVSYIPDTGVKIGRPEIGGRAPYAFDKFRVLVGGTELKKGDIDFVTEEKDEAVPVIAIFRLGFDDVGQYTVVIEYSYTLEKSFERTERSHIKSLIGLCYDLSPVKYWAGVVDSIRVYLVCKGGDISELAMVRPYDFVFTDDGCRWFWEDVSGDDIGFAGTERIELYFSPYDFFSGSGDFITVNDDAGLIVRAGPGNSYDILATVPMSERIYIYYDDGNDLLSKANDPYGDYSWYNCRLRNNSEGFVYLSND